MAEARVAVIGGSGLYDMEGLEEVRHVEVDTPFGRPSDAIVVGRLQGVPVAFLPRHGRGHRLSPSEVPARANIYALKALGVERVISVSAVGSLRTEVRPLDLVVPDQLVDRTRGRPSTFFGEGLVAHVGMADPFCPELSTLAVEVAREDGVQVHRGGAYVVIEGPQFSTRAESNIYRSWGASVIGMTALPEAKLAREAEMCYVTLAWVTDYDVWHEAEVQVSVELVIQNLRSNVETSRRLLRALIPRIPQERPCPCASALAMAIVTQPDAIPPEALRRLSAIVGKYLKPHEGGPHA